jgi:hypothetical protein
MPGTLGTPAGSPYDKPIGIRYPDKVRRPGGTSMSNNKKQTGKSAASAASKILSNPASTPAQKKVAASDLSQAPGKKKKRGS